MTPNEYLQQPYARIVIPLEEGGFHAELLEFFGCIAQGETAAEAYANLETAAESWIENALEQGHEIPLPSSVVDYSGRIVLRLPQTLHQQAALFALRDQISLNTFLVSAVANKVGAEDLYKSMSDRLENRLSVTLSNFASAFYGAWQSYSTASIAPTFMLRDKRLKVRDSAATATSKQQLTFFSVRS
jgi:antitoxin HicB